MDEDRHDEDDDHTSGLLGLGLGGLGEQHSVDVGEDTTRGNGHRPQQLVELLIIADSQLDVAGDDAGLLVVTGSIASQLQDLSGEVLQDSCQVHGGTTAHTSSKAALAEVARDTAYGELKSGLGGTRSGLGLVATTSTLAFACHLD